MQFTNRLAQETSPYLRQHAHNPVDWHPWGEEALRKAKELDRPIFLSIGYSACHWCHVMEHESFEDPEVGRLLNERFINIKVDREERPDLDQIYMSAVQLLTRHGGWPMSVFLTPGLKPFYGGTYFPPVERHNLPSFKRLVQYLAEAWRDRRKEVEEQAANVTENMQAFLQLEPAEGTLGPETLAGAGNLLRRSFDATYGGFGQAPKFPHPMELRLLLRIWKRFEDSGALEMATKTLDQMAMGGIYDQLGGGFHRYSTDARWLAPHFEKMLYDNALLAVAYLEAHQATGQPFYRRIVEETLDYVRREMTSSEGPFYSTQDADSEGVEGKFFVWSAQEIEAVLGKEVAKLFASVFDVTPEGNWEEHNILHRSRTDEQEARMLNLDVEELRSRLAASKQKLLKVRSQRVWPGRDEKILTSWNALMIAAFAQAGAVLNRPDYVEVAVRAADFLLTTMRGSDGRLLRTTTIGSSPKLNAYLEDYAYLLDALVSLYEATLEPRWVAAAIDLARVMVEQFWDPKDGSFFFTGKDHETLIARTKDPHDNATPSGNSIAVTALLRLGKLTGEREYLSRAEQTLEQFAGLMESHPLAAGQMLIALDFYLGPVREIVVVGDRHQAETQHVWRLVRGGFQPHQVVAGKDATTPAEADQVIPLLAGKTAQGTVTTYICEDFACQAPIVGLAALEKAWNV